MDRKICKKEDSKRVYNIIKPLGSMHIAFIDFNGFKEINDTCGHQVGDKIIEIVKYIISLSLSKNDILIPFGGDEFVIYYANSDSKEVIKNVASIYNRTKIEKSIIDLIGPQNESIWGLSIGLIKCPEDESYKYDEAMKDADDAMYMAKLKKHIDKTIEYIGDPRSIDHDKLAIEKNKAVLEKSKINKISELATWAKSKITNPDMECLQQAVSDFFHRDCDEIMANTIDREELFRSIYISYKGKLAEKNPQITLTIDEQQSLLMRQVKDLADLKLQESKINRQIDQEINKKKDLKRQYDVEVNKLMEASRKINELKELIENCDNKIEELKTKKVA